MQKLFTLLLLLITITGYSQTEEQGFSYQAVVRNAEGIPLTNEDLTVNITLFTKEGKVVNYSENHFTTTDQFGQINIVVGSGADIQGSLQAMPWSSGSVYYKVQIVDEDNDLDLISEAKILAVPYAFHALTADALINNDEGSGGSRMEIEQGKFWTVIGNEIQEDKNLLGTLNRSDLNIITSNQTRILINDNGPIEVFPPTTFASDVIFEENIKILQDLEVAGNSRVIGNSSIEGSVTVTGEGQFYSNLLTYADLDVYGNTRLNKNLEAGGSVELNGGLTVGMMSATHLTGTLLVDKESTLKDDLTVEGYVDLKDGLNVDGAVDMNNTLTVDGSAIFNNSMLIEGSTTINDDLYVSKDVADGQYLATFYNSNSGNGDGINIKLGKNRTSLAVPTVPQLLTPSQVNDIKNLIKCDYPGSKINLLGNIVYEGVQADIQMIAGLAIGIGNHLINFINGRIGLPLNMPTLEVVPEVPVFPGFGWQVCIPDPIDFCRGFYIDPESIGPYSLPNVQLLPAIPNIGLSDLGIQEIPIYDLNFWGIPNICLNDAPGTTPLNNENEFIRFSDNNDTKMGSIRAVSVSDWSDNYLTPSYLFKLHGAITSAVDKKHARYHFKGEVSKAIQDYVKIGVEYSSGNGDYAEWLERIDMDESIHPGDIVGVVGGKISKDLSQAEQVMVVSHNPIVLGNVPLQGQLANGNNIAFMGQVPVKITGPVSTGDYIVASPSIPGYGIAKSEDEMTIQDFKFAVGRSWENIETDGPKMVNTVVGIHNGDYSKILQKFDARFNQNESKLNVLEARLNTISDLLLSNNND